MTSSGHRPRRRFAQHFLIDEDVIERILAVVRPAAGHHLVEIGPGLGALTRGLARSGASVDAVEIDRDLAALLPERLGEPENLRVHNVDVLGLDFTRLASGARLRVLGNLPYNISSPLLFHLLEHHEVVEDMHFMLQEEVVDRLAASPGGRTYGRISVMIQLRCRVEKLFRVESVSFSPPPAVNSAVVRITPRGVPAARVDNPMHFERIVREAFSQRRKTLRNSLRKVLDPQQIEAAGVDPGARPETLDLVGFAALSNQLSR